MVREYPVLCLNRIKYDYDLYFAYGAKGLMVELDSKYYYGLKNKIFKGEKLDKYYFRLTFISDYTNAEIKLIAFSKKGGNVKRPEAHSYITLPELLKYK